MKRFLFLSILFILFLSRSAGAEDTIKVLMRESPYDPLPSGQAELVNDLEGKIFLNGKVYRGRLEIMRDEKGFYVINTLPLETYVEGAVASDIMDAVEIEAVKALAVLARTHALRYRIQNADHYYHVFSSVFHQPDDQDTADPLISRAVRMTKGEILTFNDLPINAVYHATCEGKTELPEEVWEEPYPYLKSVDCFGRNAPYEQWERKFSAETIETALGIQGLRNMSIESYTATGRVRSLSLHLVSWDSVYSEVEVRATELRQKMGQEKLPSTHFTLTRSSGSDTYIFTGRGYGHAVGLSQWGALEMARQGKDYRQILSHYYPGTVLLHDNELKHHASRDGGNAVSSQN